MAVVHIKRRARTTYLELAATVNVSQIKALHKSLTKVLERNLPVVLATGQVERIDTAGLQVLLAFYHGTQKRGLDFHWESPGKAFLETVEMLSLRKRFGLEA